MQIKFELTKNQVKLQALIDELSEFTEIRQKSNLKRLLEKRD